MPPLNVLTIATILRNGGGSVALVDALEQRLQFEARARGIVPDAIIDRDDKKGLVVPVNRWFDNELKEWSGELIDSLAKRTLLVKRAGGRGEFDRWRYAAVSLERWLRIFKDRSVPIGIE